LVGLTHIGDAHGYTMCEGDKVPAEGVLRYRGIDVGQIVEACEREGRHGFEETVYLLLFGSLPNRTDLEEFRTLLSEKRGLPDAFTEDMILKAPSTNIMNKLARATLAMHSYDDNPDATTIENMLRQSIELISRFPTMTAYSYQAKVHYYDGQSLIIHAPQKELSAAENFLYMIRPDSKFTKLEADVLDLSLILHAEHGGGNNSSFTTHVVSSSGTDTYSAITAAVGSLKGPKHGGANIRVMEMIQDFKANIKSLTDEKSIEDHIVRLIRKEGFDRSGLIYGMGHAIYTLSDPRAVLLKRKAHELAVEKGMEEEFELYNIIERLTPDIFAGHKGGGKTICANVDLYSGLVYSMLNIPPELYTPIFAISRVSGWCAHRMEEVIAAGRIIRPAYKNVGKVCDYVDLGER
jgi:citrate synthase